MSDNESTHSNDSNDSSYTTETIDLEQSEMYQVASVFFSSSKGDQNICDILLKLNKSVNTMNKTLVNVQKLLTKKMSKSD